MTDGTNGLDPRFDPRYQRGYDGSDAAGAQQSSDQHRSEPSHDSLPHSFRTEERPMPDAGSAAAAAAAATAATAASEPSAASTSSSGRASIRSSHDEPVFETDAVAEPEPESHAVRWWFGVAWAMLGACVVVGLAITWAVNSDPNTYSGINQNDLLRQMSWMIAPHLVRFALVGTVVLTVWMGVRQVLAAQPARAAIEAEATGDPSSPSAERRVLPRVPAVAVLFGLIGAGAVVVVWWSSISGDRSIYNYGAAPSEEQLSAMAWVQTAGAVVGPAVETMLWSAFGLIVLGASAAMAGSRNRIAVVSAVRARSARQDRP